MCADYVPTSVAAIQNKFRLAALLYRNDTASGAEQDEALDLFEELAKKGHMKSQYYAGMMVADEKKKADYFAAASDQGYGPALFRLAGMLERGEAKGRSPDETHQAVFYAAVSALNLSKEDDAECQFCLGLANFEASGTPDPDNLAKGVESIERAAETGHPQAQYYLGKVFSGHHASYLAGDSRSADRAAHKWMERAKAQGHKLAKKWLKQNS